MSLPIEGRDFVLGMTASSVLRTLPETGVEAHKIFVEQMYDQVLKELMLKNPQKSTTQKLACYVSVGSVRKWHKAFFHGMGRIHGQSKKGG